MTQTQLGDAVGIAQSVISRIEKDRYDIDSLGSGVLFNLCRVLECSPIWLMTGNGEPQWREPGPLVASLLNEVADLSPEGIQALLVTAKALKR